jgi:hypothetical protein
MSQKYVYSRSFDTERRLKWVKRCHGQWRGTRSDVKLSHQHDANSRASLNCHFRFISTFPRPPRELQQNQKMSEQPQSLRELFLGAERARQELLSSSDSNSPTFQENLLQTIATYEECLKVSKQISLFSPNESLEDISSSDLQYVHR